MGGSTPSTVARLGLVAAILAVLPGCAALGLRWPEGHGTAGTHAAAPAPDARERDKAVAAAERAVAGNPGDPASRAALGRAYLAAGRPASAIGALGDAMALGETTPATIVALALAQVAVGQQEAAVRLLDEWHDSVPQSDLGLALALAGEPSRAVAVLTDALRRGMGDARLRQNLAYAHALNGRWRVAALIAAQDLPPARVQQRIEVWARLAPPEAAGERVAHVLGTRLRADPGYPPALALAPGARPSSAAELAAAPSR